MLQGNFSLRVHTRQCGHIWTNSSLSLLVFVTTGGDSCFQFSLKIYLGLKESSQLTDFSKSYKFGIQGWSFVDEFIVVIHNSVGLKFQVHHHGILPCKGGGQVLSCPPFRSLCLQHSWKSVILYKSSYFYF